MNMKYCTSDFPTATVLYTLGFKLSHFDRTNPERIEFCFERNEYLDKTIECWWRGELKIEPQSLFSSQKVLKSRIHSEK